MKLRRVVCELGAILALAGCGAPALAPGTSGQPGPAPAARVFIVGIDAGNWAVLGPAMESGIMPNLKRLTARGSRGVLHSMDPTASAVIWTTLATGRLPEDHGILGFVAPKANGELAPVTSNMRRVKALWNIVSEAGLEVGFVGWWVTWPAEPVRGFMASDYTWPLLKSDRGFATGADPDLELPARTYPPELMDELRPLLKLDAGMSPQELDRLGVGAIPRVRGYAVRDIMLKDISLGDIADRLLERYRPALFAVYFDGLDAFCHVFWPHYLRYLEARDQGDGAAMASLPGHVRSVGAAMDAHLGRIDGYLGRVMDHAGPQDVILVISDHGYGDNPGRQPILRGYGEWITPPHWHRLEGMVAASGGPIARGRDLGRATVLDIAPTVLALLGLPVAADMDGRVLTEMLTSEFLEAHPVTQVPTYEDRLRGGDAPIASSYDEAILERLRSLGYVD